MLSAPDIERLKKNREVVICDSAAAGSAHRELFRFGDDAYFVADGEGAAFGFLSDTVDFCNGSTSEAPAKIHISLNWENLLRVSLWQASKPSSGDIFVLLKNAGMGQDDLRPFRNTDPNDLFPYLYYAKRFDVLRKICHAAKRQAEGRMKRRLVRVDSHVVSEDAGKIVASSL